MAHLCVEDSDSIEEPVGHHKQQHQNRKQGPEYQDPRVARPRGPEEQRPDSQQQDEQLEGNRDEEALAGHATTVELLRPEEVGEHQEGQRGQEHQQAQNHSQRQGEVATAVQPHAILQILGDSDDVLLRQTVLWRACDGCGGLAPVVIL